MFDNLLLTREGAVAVATINRPQVLNALDTKTLHELRRLTAELADDARVRSVIVTGTGNKAFVAGADIRELAALSPAAAREHARLGQQVCDQIERMGKPVIAALNGFALGGGCELAMACTLRVAADTARLGQPEVNLGLIPGFGGTQRLTRLVGTGVALDLMLTGRQVGAEEALRIGLVNRVVPAESLMTAARTLADDLAARAPLAMRYIIDAVHRGLDGSLDDAQTLEASLFGLAASTADMREGTRAFLEKRKPAFTGE
ncbi:MAG TPA: enoyl-CoA hydratase-related protein [Vicinamibacterales bacterium]|nr:enoyl-CoA hydratase-related protein [Vicinamibacterales bacterium]